MSPKVKTWGTVKSKLSIVLIRMNVTTSSILVTSYPLAIVNAFIQPPTAYFVKYGELHLHLQSIISKVWEVQDVSYRNLFVTRHFVPGVS